MVAHPEQFVYFVPPRTKKRPVNPVQRPTPAQPAPPAPSSARSPSTMRTSRRRYASLTNEDSALLPSGGGTGLHPLDDPLDAREHKTRGLFGFMRSKTPSREPSLVASRFPASGDPPYVAERFQSAPISSNSLKASRVQQEKQEQQPHRLVPKSPYSSYKSSTPDSGDTEELSPALFPRRPSLSTSTSMPSISRSSTPATSPTTESPARFGEGGHGRQVSSGTRTHTQTVVVSLGTDAQMSASHSHGHVASTRHINAVNALPLPLSSPTLLSALSTDDGVKREYTFDFSGMMGGLEPQYHLTSNKNNATTTAATTKTRDPGDEAEASIAHNATPDPDATSAPPRAATSHSTYAPIQASSSDEDDDDLNFGFQHSLAQLDTNICRGAKDEKKRQKKEKKERKAAEKAAEKREAKERKAHLARHQLAMSMRHRESDDSSISERGSLSAGMAGVGSGLSRWALPSKRAAHPPPQSSPSPSLSLTNSPNPNISPNSNPSRPSATLDHFAPRPLPPQSARAGAAATPTAATTPAQITAMPLPQPYRHAHGQDVSAAAAAPRSSIEQTHNQTTHTHRAFSLTRRSRRPRAVSDPQRAEHKFDGPVVVISAEPRTSIVLEEEDGAERICADSKSKAGVASSPSTPTTPQLRVLVEETIVIPDRSSAANQSPSSVSLRSPGPGLGRAPSSTASPTLLSNTWPRGQSQGAPAVVTNDVAVLVAKQRELAKLTEAVQAVHVVAQAGPAHPPSFSMRRRDQVMPPMRVDLPARVQSSPSSPRFSPGIAGPGTPTGTGTGTGAEGFGARSAPIVPSSLRSSYSPKPKVGEMEAVPRSPRSPHSPRSPRSPQSATPGTDRRGSGNTLSTRSSHSSLRGSASQTGLPRRPSLSPLMVTPLTQSAYDACPLSAVDGSYFPAQPIPSSVAFPSPKASPQAGGFASRASLSPASAYPPSAMHNAPKGSLGPNGPPRRTTRSKSFSAYSMPPSILPPHPPPTAPLPPIPTNARRLSKSPRTSTVINTPTTPRGSTPSSPARVPHPASASPNRASITVAAANAAVASFPDAPVGIARPSLATIPAGETMPVTGVVNLQRKLSTGPPRPPRRRSFLAPAAEIGSISSGRKDLERPLSDCSPTLPNDRPLSDEYESPLTGVLNDLLSGKYDGGVNIKRALHGSPASTSTGICDEAITPAAVEVDDEDPFAYESVLARRSTTVVINSAATSPSTKTAEVAADGFRAAWPQRVVS